MLFSYEWLKQFVDIPASTVGGDKKPQELADDLSCKSVEVEGIEKFGGKFLETVVVGKIKEINPHPNADKLQVVIVDIGEKSHLTIVCGAPNIEVSQKVPVALVGTKLPMGDIKKTKIRGIGSSGMLAAPDELLLGSDHEGILILDPDLKTGTKLSDVYNDWVLDGDILSHRGDLQNHLGFAREVAAIHGKKLTNGEIKRIKDSGNDIEKYLVVENKTPKNCPAYMARMIRGVKIGPSPIFIQKRLIACGMKPINNIVDATNFVMLEYGNPLHAFDASKIKKALGKHKIIVRLSEKNESITTLDEESRVLPKGVLVIADTKAPIAVAGIMGGANSEIGEETTDIILESASFDPQKIRFGQRELGARTEASARFEKGLSTYLAEISLDRATQLIASIAGGKIISGRVLAGELEEKKKEIEVDIEKMKGFMSLPKIKEREISYILDTLGIENKIKGGKLVCMSPLWRRDLSIWQDIAEEVGRIYGYDNVDKKDLSLEIEPQTEKVLYFEQSAKKYLSQIGMTEIFTYSILSKELVKSTGMDERFFEITNPMNENDFILRSGMLSGLLGHAVENAKKFDRFAFFDLNKVFIPSKDKKSPAYEQRRLGMLVYGEGRDEGLFVLKNYLDQFAENFRIKLEYKNSKGMSFAHPGRCADILYKGKKIGKIFEVHPMVLENLDIKSRTWVSDLDFDSLIEDVDNLEESFSEVENDTIFEEYSKYEVSKRDIAILVDKKIEVEKVSDIIKKTDEKVVSVEVFDEYESDKLGKNKKSLAYHLTFQSKDRTLKDKEVDDLFDKILANLSKKFNAKLRR